MGHGALAATAVVLAAGTAVYASAESHILGTTNPNAIAGSYLVVFREAVVKTGQITVSTLTGRLASRYDVKLEHT